MYGEKYISVFFEAERKLRAKKINYLAGMSETQVKGYIPKYKMGTETSAGFQSNRVLLVGPSFHPFEEAIVFDINTP